MLKSKPIPPEARQVEGVKQKLKEHGSQGVTNPSRFKIETQDPKEPSEPPHQLPIKLARQKTIDPAKYLARSAELVRHDLLIPRSKCSDHNSAIWDKSVSAMTNKKGSRASLQLSPGKSRRSPLTPVTPLPSPAMMNRRSLLICPISGNSAKI
jgi:hypothetical protein